MEDYFVRYGGWVAAILYVLVRDGLPIMGNVLEKWLPIRSRQRQMEMEAEKLSEERREQRREREVVALESIGKSLVLSAERLGSLERGQEAILNALNFTNQSLAIVLDRVNGKHDTE